jgi:hypothetical protein
MGLLEPLGRERIERRPFSLQSHVGVVLQHLGRDMPSDRHNRAVTGLRLGEFGDRVVP